MGSNENSVDLNTIPRATDATSFTVGDRVQVPKHLTPQETTEFLGTLFTNNRHHNNNHYRLWAVKNGGVSGDSGEADVMGWHRWNNPGQNLIHPNGELEPLTKETLQTWIEKHPGATIVVIGGSEREAQSVAKLNQIAEKHGLTATGNSSAEKRSAAIRFIIQTNPSLFRNLIKFLGENLRNPNIFKEISSKLNLEGVDLSEMNLAGANLQWMNLQGINLQGADLTGANLPRANLTNANLSNKANLTDANLIYANLTNADLTLAFLVRADLKGARLAGANLQNAYLQGADLTGATYDMTTQWPEGFSPETRGAKKKNS